MRELQIFDKVPEEPDMLIPNGVVIAALRRCSPNGLEGRWRVRRGAWGSGPRIAAIEDALEQGEDVLVEGEEFFAWAEADVEQFYDVHLSREDGALEVGVFDSTYWFVRAPDDVLECLRERFTRTEIPEQPGGGDATGGAAQQPGTVPHPAAMRLLARQRR